MEILLRHIPYTFVGIAVPSGLFIPALLSGSALGRFVGEVLRIVFDRIDPGTYALIGSFIR